MEWPKPATMAWSALIGGVAMYNLNCPVGETLSEGADRALERPLAKFAVLGLISMTALHLSNLIPEQADLIHKAFAWRHAGEAV